MLSLFLSFAFPLSCHPSLARFSCSALLRLPLQRLGTWVSSPSLTPVSQPFGPALLFSPSVLRRLRLLLPVTSGGRSPRLSRHTVPTFRLQPRDLPRHRFSRSPQRTGRFSDFAFCVPARRHTPPNRVRPPADRQLASSCSPPRLATTQFLSATRPWLTLTRTFTVQMWRLRGRTRCGLLPARRSNAESRP